MLLMLLVFNNIGAQSAFPVTLSNPMDYDTIIETEPNFIWQTNITALQTDPRYTQRYVLCEIEENQLKGEAIAVNTPLLVLEDYQNTMYSYSSTTTPLEKGHTYVWQVSILFNELVVDQSEPYQFTILKPEDPTPSFYPVVFKNDGQTYQVSDNKIGLITDESGDLELTIHIYKNGLIDKTTLLKEFIGGKLSKESAKVSPGKSDRRFFLLDLKDLDLKSGYYRVVWSPKSNKDFTFNFQIN
jgi:hypothetical protein